MIISLSETRNQKSEITTVHFIGIGGIGMSGLAQFFKWAEYQVSGSDRALDNPEKKELFEKLTLQGIKLYAQDGSYADKQKTDILVYSTAVEDGNPDFLAGKDLPRWHRAEALAFLSKKLKGKTSIAVTGSCGKTSVTAWIGEVLANLDLDPIVLNGGMINSFKSEKFPGNFKFGVGRFFVFEADESDKSLVAFTPDYSVILNIGTDHYSKEELIEVFEKFLRNTKKGAVIEKQVYDQLNPESYRHLKTVLFLSNDIKNKKNSIWLLGDYCIQNGTAKANCIKNELRISLKLPVPGIHNAANALSIFALTDLLELDNTYSDIVAEIESFKGVHRRFEYVGKTENGAAVYNDYAHNVEKIASAIATAQDVVPGRVFAVFQPHGYGPLSFMRDVLFPTLENALRKEDCFIFMPVYYAGGTSSFTPKSSVVCKEYELKSAVNDKYLTFNSREDAGKYLLSISGRNDIILIMGARDDSLSIWADELIQTNNSNKNRLLHVF
jgi:UDP-N-acetylmuramate--alanine ligase